MSALLNSSWIETLARLLLSCERSFQIYVLLIALQSSAITIFASIDTVLSICKGQLSEHVLYRADSIVQDAEAVRAALVPPESCNGRMAILGQSFGGFCCLTYLSMRPQGNAPLPLSHPCYPMIQRVSCVCHFLRLAERMYGCAPDNDHQYAIIAGISLMLWDCCSSRFSVKQIRGIGQQRCSRSMFARS